MNYIQSILTKTAVVKMTGYQRFLNEVRKEVPTITSQGYWGKNGKFYQINDKGSPYYGIIQKYRMIQYNMMFFNVIIGPDHEWYLITLHHLFAAPSLILTVCDLIHKFICQSWLMIS